MVVKGWIKVINEESNEGMMNDLARAMRRWTEKKTQKLVVGKFKVELMFLC
jgi:hypothetical protein